MWLVTNYHLLHYRKYKLHAIFLIKDWFLERDKTGLNITVSLTPSTMHENFTSQKLTNALHSEKNLSQCHFVHQKSYMDWPEI
jgi:hypothetical protein